MDTTACPEPGCSLPADIRDRAILESTDGPLEHARIACLDGHRFLMPTGMLPQRQDLWSSVADVITLAMSAARRGSS